MYFLVFFRTLKRMGQFEVERSSPMLTFGGPGLAPIAIVGGVGGIVFDGLIEI